jgi:hypothetical protein
MVSFLAFSASADILCASAASAETRQERTCLAKKDGQMDMKLSMLEKSKLWVQI